MSRLFISHSSKDNIAAIAFKQWLCANDWSDQDIFLDLDNIGAGERWKQALFTANLRCEAVILLATPDLLSSPECRLEVRHAEDLGKEIIVVLLRDLEVKDQRLASFSDRQIVDLSAQPKSLEETVFINGKKERILFNREEIEKIKNYLIRRGIAPDHFAWPPRDRPTAEPFPGLNAFREEDAGIFFGRDADIVRGLDKIRFLRRKEVSQLLVIQAASGAGKSSYLQAGLWPRLARDPDFRSLAVVRPASGILTGPEGLGHKFAQLLSRPGHVISPGEIHIQLKAGSLSSASDHFSKLLQLAILQAYEQRQLSDPSARQPALILGIDQAEELFSYDLVESERFLLLLASFFRQRWTAPASQLFCLFTIRADKVGRLMQAFSDLQLDAPEIFPLLPLPSSSFREIITGPIRVLQRRGDRLEIDPGLADRLVRDSSGADALPLLAFTISHLYREFAQTGRLTLEQYEQIEGITGSIEVALKQAMGKPDDSPSIPQKREDQLALLRRTFIPSLARIETETSLPTRRVARLDEFSDNSRAMVDRLVEARLLTVDQHADVDVVEIAHEALLREWLSLAAWLQADADDLRLVDGVERAAREWAHNGRNDAWINDRGERLIAAERVAAREDFRGRFGEQALAYLKAARVREVNERLRHLLTSAGRKMLTLAEKQSASPRELAELTRALVQTLIAVEPSNERWKLRLDLADNHDSNEIDPGFLPKSVI